MLKKIVKSSVNNMKQPEGECLYLYTFNFVLIEHDDQTIWAVERQNH